jgi:ferritin-like protein
MRLAPSAADAMADPTMHEPTDLLRAETRELHRAIASLMEELEAIDWYQQRIDATSDPELAAVLAHNRDEEIEHAMMVLEWIRSRQPTFDAEARKYLFRGPGVHEDAPAAPEADGSLAIGSLRGRPPARPSPWTS